MCIEITEYVSAEVTLNAPPGGRIVVDGAAGFDFEPDVAAEAHSAMQKSRQGAP